MASDSTTVTFKTDCMIRIQSVECSQLRHGELTITQVSGDDPDEIAIIVEPCGDCLKEAECGREHAD